ncbi:hypothetical protein DSO57_1019837 [Entomophthora muscae]|uniref:Uncharacterized protein n=1 Tax=Entomophthora muscae TaxID=34485 RepID=A0ACC2TSA8_9FUNG|nr:hypothetical protein DSO57_1019837 [Entomophthora muscae]
MLTFLFAILNLFLVACVKVQLNPGLSLHECKGKVWYRPNVLNRTDAQWNRFVEAVKMVHGDKEVLEKRIAIESVDYRKKYLELLRDNEDYSVYDQLVKIHIQHYDKYHNTSLFLPWHRAYVLLFERELLRVDPLVRLPYWDFTIHRALYNDPALSTERFGGSGLVNVALRPMGSFSNLLNYYHWDKDEYRYISRSNRFLAHRPISAVALMIDYILLDNYSEFTKHFEPSVHGEMHKAIGKEFFEHSSPNDPLFFSFHSFVDKIFLIWQEKHGYSLDSIADEQLEPFGIKVRDILNPKNKGCFTFKNLELVYNSKGDPLPEKLLSLLTKFTSRPKIAEMESPFEHFNISARNLGLDLSKIQISNEEVEDRHNSMYDPDIIEADIIRDNIVQFISKLPLVQIEEIANGKLQEKDPNHSQPTSTPLAIALAFIFSLLHLI